MAQSTQEMTHNPGEDLLDPELNQARALLDHDAETAVEILLKQVGMRAEGFGKSPNEHLNNEDNCRQLLLDLVLEKLHQRTGQ